MKVITASASVATAIALFPLVPKIFKLIDAARQSELRRVEIEQLNQELERFNYSVAHDLRAPLRGISGFSQILREDCTKELSPEAQEYLDRIQDSVGQMDALITDLLKYATIGRQKVNLEPVPLDEVVRATLGLMNPEIINRQAEVIVTGQLPIVLGDAVMLQVIFQNLIANSLKFVAPGVKPRIEISTERLTVDTIAIYVSDNGVGIPAEARERIFGLFERFHPEHAGTGIGLSLVQRAIERIKGKISLVEPLSGAGTRFQIVLPLGRALPKSSE